MFNPALTSVLKTQCSKEPFEELLAVPASQGIEALVGDGKLKTIQNNPDAATVVVDLSSELFITDIPFRAFSYIVPC